MTESMPANSPIYCAPDSFRRLARKAGVRTLKELARSYLTITKDLTPVMNRIKGLYRSWAIPCAGQKVYSRYRIAWLKTDGSGGVAPAGVVVSTIG